MIQMVIVDDTIQISYFYPCESDLGGQPQDNRQISHGTPAYGSFDTRRHEAVVFPFFFSFFASCSRSVVGRRGYTSVDITKPRLTPRLHMMSSLRQGSAITRRTADFGCRECQV